VGPSSQPDAAFVLNEPTPPMMDVLHADDCRATYEELSAALR
jgi:hypothetical protein